MNLLLDPAFWLTVVLAQLLLSIERGRRATRFGAINLVAIAALAGWRAAAAIVLLAVTLWLILKMLDRARMAALVIAGLALLFVFYKVSREHPGALPGDAAMAVLAAVSFSYVFLRAVDLTMAVSGHTAPLVGPVALVGYLAPFHMLPAGPINNYRDHAAIDSQPQPALTFPLFVVHLNTIANGLFYKFVIAESLRMFAFGVHGPLAAPNSLAGTSYLLVYLFFDFAGYSKIALGIGGLIGIPTPVNFRAPLLSTSVTDFWNRWHMSLGAWVFRNIYTPLQVALVRRAGTARSRQVNLVTLAVAFGFVGIWHRVSVPFLLWGLSMGAIMFVERMIRDSALGQQALRHRSVTLAMRVAGPVYVIAVISLSLRLIMREFLGV